MSIEKNDVEFFGPDLYRIAIQDDSFEFSLLPN